MGLSEITGGNCSTGCRGLSPEEIVTRGDKGLAAALLGVDLGPRGLSGPSRCHTVPTRARPPFTLQGRDPGHGHFLGARTTAFPSENTAPCHGRGWRPEREPPCPHVLGTAVSWKVWLGGPRRRAAFPRGCPHWSPTLKQLPTATDCALCLKHCPLSKHSPPAHPAARTASLRAISLHVSLSPELCALRVGSRQKGPGKGEAGADPAGPAALSFCLR